MGSTSSKRANIITVSININVAVNEPAFVKGIHIARILFQKKKEVDDMAILIFLKRIKVYSRILVSLLVLLMAEVLSVYRENCVRGKNKNVGIMKQPSWDGIIINCKRYNTSPGGFHSRGNIDISAIQVHPFSAQSNG